MTRRRIALFCAGAAIAGIAIAWLELGPRELGGRATYEPGDVVAYRSEKLERVVLHRIVALDRDSFVTAETRTTSSTPTGRRRTRSSGSSGSPSPTAERCSAGSGSRSTPRS